MTAAHEGNTLVTIYNSDMIPGSEKLSDGDCHRRGGVYVLFFFPELCISGHTLDPGLATDKPKTLFIGDTYIQ